MMLVIMDVMMEKIMIIKINYEDNNEDDEVKIITLMIMKKDIDGKDDENHCIDANEDYD